MKEHFTQDFENPAVQENIARPAVPNALIKYTLVGLSSTVVQYVFYSVCYYFTESLLLSNTLGFITSVWNSFFWNRRIVFQSRYNTTWWRVLIKSYATYFATGIVATNLLSFLFVRKIGLSAYISPIIIVLILYPINYLINKYWTHRKEFSDEGCSL